MNVLAIQAIDWSNRTNVDPWGLLFTVLLGFAALLLPRRWAALPLLTLACFIPAGQRIVLFSLDFSFLRILLLVYALRVLFRREVGTWRPHPLDGLLLAWICAQTLAYTVLHGSVEALVFKLGESFDAIGYYFVFRVLVRSWKDLEYLTRGLALLTVPCLAAFLVERFTGHNLFAMFGGVPAITDVREGRLRCQGAFSHPILAGCFWAAAAPLIGALWWASARFRPMAAVGLASAGSIVLLTASSTPVAAVGVSVLGAASFLLRRHFRAGRIAAVLIMLTLHLVMKAPVWHLVARITVVGGSTGWHRFLLIDETIKHFGDWWLVGTTHTERWGPGLGDMTNQYVLEAVRGGLLGLCLFVSTIAFGFHSVGRTWRRAWPRKDRVALSWALGVSLFAQCVAFLGVSYFGQIWVLWFLVLACIASMDLVPSAAQPPADARSSPLAPAT